MAIARNTLDDPSPMMTQPLPPRDERHLTRLYRGLDEESRATLLRFAEFLSATGNGGGAGALAQRPALAEPELIARPLVESVVGAIKRLSLSYPMLDRRRMLDETSILMAAHVLNGRPARDVIDELEALFARHYGLYRDDYTK